MGATQYADVAQTHNELPVDIVADMALVSGIE